MRMHKMMKRIINQKPHQSVNWLQDKAKNSGTLTYDLEKAWNIFKWSKNKIEVNAGSLVFLKIAVDVSAKMQL